jgi:hypothetical protein
MPKSISPKVLQAKIRKSPEIKAFINSTIGPPPSYFNLGAPKM